MAVWGPSGNDVWAVGEAGTVMHWDGAAWSRWHLQSRAHWQAIWGRAADDVWIAGNLAEGKRLGAVFHWDGHAWSDTRFPWSMSLESIGASDEGSVWVANNVGRIWGWDGRGWQPRHSPPERPDILCTAVKLHTAAGGLMIKPCPLRDYWDGTAVVSAKNPPSPRSRTFGGTRSSSMLLREYSTIGEVTRWDGTRWVALGTMESGHWSPRGLYARVGVRAIWGASDDDTWVVGSEGAILRWNGSTWRRFESGTHADLEHIWGTGPNDVWATGGPGTAEIGKNDAQAILHWDGTRWRNTITAVSEVQLNGVWGSDRCHVWAVGAGGSVLRRNCDGWSAVASGVTADLWGVGGSGPDDVWVVGDAGTILHLGTGDRLTPAPTRAGLRAVWSASARDAWAVGEKGTILRWDGASWNKVTSPTTGPLRAVQGRGADYVVATGSGADVIVWNGTAWSELARVPYGNCIRPWDSTPNEIVGVWVRAPGDLWANCQNETLMHWDGHQWIVPRLAPASVPRFFFGIAGLADSPLAVGGLGAITRKSGDTWIQSATDTAAPLRAVWVSPRGEVWVVGDRGTIFSLQPSNQRPPAAPRPRPAPPVSN